MNEAIKQKLEQIAEHRVLVMDDEGQTEADAMAEVAKEALALLKPKCKTCGGSGELCLNKIPPHYVPCPDCKPSELVTRIRWLAKDYELGNQPNLAVGEVIEDLRKAADHIEQYGDELSTIETHVEMLISDDELKRIGADKFNQRPLELRIMRILEEYGNKAERIAELEIGLA